MWWHGFRRPSVRPCVCVSVNFFLVYAIKSTVFVRFFSNLFSVFIFMRTRTLLKMGYIRPSVCRPSMSYTFSCLRDKLHSFHPILFKLVQCLYIYEDSNPIENGLHETVCLPCVRACVRPCVRLFLVYAINSTVFIQFFSNLFSVFIFIRTQTLLKMGYIRPSVCRPCVRPCMR